jgi:flagellar operon protein
MVLFVCVAGFGGTAEFIVNCRRIRISSELHGRKEVKQDMAVNAGAEFQLASIAEHAARVQGGNGRIGARQAESEAANSFGELLSGRFRGGQKEISFSKHADTRARERNIAVEGGDLRKLSDACDKAVGKGLRNALIVMNDSAFIVNAGSKIVVTVVDKNEMKGNIFTNIEGAVFL